MNTPRRLVGNRYVLLRQIGQGGMGAVWLALDEVLGRQVAVKRVGLFPGGTTPDLVRAQREAKLAARLNHPHVVAVYDFVTDGDEQWLVMEYVEGADLAVLAQPDGFLPDDAAALLGQVAEALAAAHSAGIVHRDVKPSNVLVTPEGTAKLADFGIARARDSTVTATARGTVTGSPAYLAPEVASGQRATEASDVWSLGATLFHALTGRPPYDTSDGVLVAMYRIVNEDPPRLDGAGWPADLLAHTMTTDPAQRWPMSRVASYLRSGPSTDELASVAATQPDPELTTEPDATPPAADLAAQSAHPDDERRWRIWTVPLAAALVLLVIAALVAWALMNQDPAPTAEESPARHEPAASSSTPSRSAAGTPSPTRSATKTSQPPTSAPETSAAPTTSPTTPTTSPTTPDSTPAPSGPGSAGGQPAAMRSFVQQYVATALTDPATSWQQLSTRFQEACCDGSLGSYAGYWNTIAAATLRDVRADPEAMRVSYVITWDPEGARPPEDELVTLGLVEQDGRYLIDYEL